MNAKIIYLAGLLDGDGHFRVDNAKNGQGRAYIRPQIAFCNTNEDVILWLHKNFRGYSYLTTYAKSTNRNPLWRWNLTGRKAVELAHLLEPYLVIKKYQVQRLTRIKYNERGWMDRSTAYMEIGGSTK